MDELKKLYDVLVREGKYSKSFEEFQTKWSQDEQYKNKVYDVVSRDKLYSKDKDSFFQKYSATPPSSVVEDSTPLKKKEDTTVLSSEDGLLEPQESPELPVLSQESLYQKIQRAPKSEADVFLVEQQKERTESLALIKETEARQIEEKKAELEQQKEAEKINLGLRTKEDFTTTLNSIVNSNLTSKTEEDAIIDLRRNFEKYGISFEETGFGTDKIIARTIDGKKSIEIDFDNYTEGDRVASANKLKDFISDNASEVTRVPSGDFLDNSLKAKNLREIGMINPDGSTSTVQFTSFEEDGKFKVIPTLFPKDPNNYSTNPNSWTKLEFKEALKLARDRGEVFEFKSDKEAKEFAKGAWKDVNPIDAEADKFYKERGLDYMSNKKTYEEYVNVRDMIDFIEENKGGKTIDEYDERSPKYQSLIINGRLRSDADQLLEKYKAQEKQLRNQVFDEGFISEGKIQKTREEFDEYLDKRQSKVAQEAAELNTIAKAQAQDVEIKSISLFGLSVEDLMKYKPSTEQEAINKNNIVKLYEESRLTQSFAAKKYENAKTYFDAKVNKQIKGEYEDNWSAFSSEVSNAYKNGKAAEQILAFTLGIKDVDSKTDKAEAARIIVENLTNQSANSSRAMARWQQASGFAEGLDALLDNPFELITTMAATSLSQILPYGMKIVPATTAAGAGTGAAIGATGFVAGPTGIISTPGGAVTGGVIGFRTGMAATSLAMEYTNSVLDIMREKGYDVTDPNQVEKAFDDESVWDEGRERGLKRGIPIAVVDYLSAGIAGRVFKPTSALASTGTRVGLQTAERAVFDPLAEATGELAAQAVAGQEIDWKEISAEAMGGLGNNSSNMAINTYRTIKNSTDINIANNLTDISFVGTESASDKRISAWANNMQQLGKIDADVNQRIQENVGLRRDARDVLSVGVKSSDVKSNVLARTMELMSAKEQLSSSVNRREIYSDRIKAINNELAVIAETKELAPDSQSVNLDTTIGTTRKGVGQYMINGVRYTKEQFLEKTRGMSARRILRSAISVKNDEEVGNEVQQIVEEKIESQLTNEELNNLRPEEDAIQEQTAGQVPVQSETEVSEALEGEIPETGPQVVAETQEEGGKVVFSPQETAYLERNQELSERFREAETEAEKKAILEEKDNLNVEFGYDVANRALDKNLKVELEKDIESSRSELERLKKPSLLDRLAISKKDRAKMIKRREEYIEEDQNRLAEINERLNQPQTIIEGEVSSKTQPEIVETVETEAEGTPEADLKKAKEEIRKQAKEEIARVLDDDTLTEQQQEEKINQIVASAKVQMNLNENDLKSPNIIFQPPTLSLNVSNPFKKGLINLGYTDADISNMTLEQQQDILINKTQKAEVASSAKVDSVKQNERQERIAELQRQLDLEVEQETPQAETKTDDIVEGVPRLTQSEIDAVEKEINEREGTSSSSIGREGAKKSITTTIGGREVSYTKDEINKINEIENRLPVKDNEKGEDVNWAERYKEEFAVYKSVLQRHLNELKAEAAKPKVEQSTVSEATQSFANELDGTQEDVSEFIQGATKVTIGNTEVILSEKGDNIAIESIRTPREERGQGSARIAINQVVETADRQGKTLQLNVAATDPTVNADQLVGFYESVGFVKEKGFDSDGGLMTRAPQTTQNNETTKIETQDETGQQPTVQPERTGDRTRRTDSREITPLEGTPTVQGATGPDAQLVAVAEQYAADNGIDLKRQSEYVKVDEDRAKRIANAYEEMANDPQNPKVKEAYAELIKQTKAQYQALVDAGYKFWFMDLNIPSNLDYAASPYNAARDLRQNKQMGVFPTTDGFGTDENLDVSNNPLLEDTGIMWAVGGLEGEMKPVLANDLFRAVHDAFGHGLEGAGFRARGEENAFQAHSRLYTGSAIGAMASETRGQNSWVNFGPFGEQNRTASAEDTVFADQKTGLMPEWAWTEGLAGDMQSEAEVAENLAEGSVSQELNEQDLPGYDRMMGEVEGIVKKSKKRRVSEAKIADNVMSYVMGSKAYENATDVQREALVRDIRKRFGLKEKSAPSVARLFGKIKDVKKITMTEKVALKKQIRDLARGARDAVRAFRLASQQLSKDVKELKQSGKITADQAANIIRAFSKVNVFSAKSVDRFTNYMAKVFENADYATKIKEAKSLRSNLKKLSKNKDKNANLRVAAAQFVKIDPALVEDIETYNEVAAKLKEAVKGSSIRGQKVKFAETTNIKEATDYISKTLKEQEQKIREERIAELQDLMGVDASEFSAEEMLALLEPEAKTNKYNEGIVRATIKRAFNVYSAVIKESISTGKDIFTDEDVEYTKAQKELIKKFMNMDTDKMSAKDSLAAVDSLINFLTNQSTAKMEAVVRKYTGQQNAEKIARQGIFAVPLKKLGMKGFGRFLGEQTTNLNILFEKMFVGFNRSGKVRDAMGLTDLVNGKSKAQRQTNTIVDNYVSEFYNKKANNQKFNTLYNNVERGMTSFMSRNIIGTETEMRAEFNRRKKLIEESIEVLSIGNEQERKKALVYQEAYDKILDGSNNIDDVQSKVDPTNLEAVDFWIKEWDSKFDELSDTALNIYNKVLDKDLNYTPDRFTRMSYDGGSVDLANTASAFITNTNGNLYKKETGVLMEATRPKELPRNAETNETDSFIDLSFDKNNSNSMYDALVDINTAGPIRQVEGFMNTAEFRRIFGVDADLIKGTKSSVGRIQQYINNIRNKNPYSNDEFAKAMRSLNKIATLGVGQALAGPTQPLKQVVPVVFNTLINAKGNVDFSAMSNKDFMSWLNESGYAIANRGVESQADVDSINKMIDEAAESKGEKAIALLESANKKWLNILLVKPDVWIAIASWKSYYEQSLKKQGVDSKNLDYKTHQINKKAADYAQRMVDRQQNVSDTDMAGTMFSNRNPYAQSMVKIFMPFASFRMNQASRLGADLRTLSKWKISTVEDRQIAARSLAGYAVEMAVFRVLSMGLAIAISSLTASLMGKEDDEEEKEKRRDNLMKGAVTSTLIDIVSPIPVFDKLVQNNAAFLLENIQKALGAEDEDIKNIYTSRKANFVDALGTFGIAAKRIDEVWDLISLASTGTYKNDFRKTIQIDSNNQEALMKIAPVVLLSIITGFASPEISSIGRNATRMAKKKDKTFEELKKQRAKDLLGGYDNKTDLKRYNPKLYEKNFGKGSDWYESTKEEREAKLKEDKEEREMKDKMYNYTKKDGFGSKKFGEKKRSREGGKSFGGKKFGAD